MKIKNIKVCAFDAYGTCFDVNSAAENVAPKIGENWLSFSNTWRTSQLEYTWLRSLMKKHVNFWKITEDSLDYAMTIHKIDKSLRDELLNLYKTLNPYPELKECLEKLKQKNIKTCILSNGTPDLINHLVSNANVKNLFDEILSIEQVKIYKPDPKVYEMTTKKFNCKPSEVCFMSANNWDIVGGGVFGYQCVWVNRNNRVFDELGFHPKNTIKNLTELNNLV